MKLTAKRFGNIVKNLPSVGKNLHDHLMVPIRYHATKDTGHTSTALHFIGGMIKDFLAEGFSMLKPILRPLNVKGCKKVFANWF